MRAQSSSRSISRLSEVAPLDCQVYDAWCVFFGCRCHADKLRLRVIYYTSYTCFLHSLERRMERIVIDAGRTRLRAGVRHEAAARASRCACALPPGLGGLFGFKFSSKTKLKTIAWTSRGPNDGGHPRMVPSRMLKLAPNHGDAPFHHAIERLGAITSQPVLGGLHHQYCRI